MAGTTAARVGAALCLVSLGLLALPYAVLDGSEVSVYYGVGPVSPLYLAVLPAVTLVALLGAARGRSDPVTAAGASIAVAGSFVLLVGLWALAAGDVVGSLTVAAAFDRHRWALLVAGAGLLATTGWFARAALSGTVPQGP